MGPTLCEARSVLPIKRAFLCSQRPIVANIDLSQHNIEINRTSWRHCAICEASDTAMAAVR